MQTTLVLKDVRVGNYARERIDHKLSRAMERYQRELAIRVVLTESKGTFEARVMSAVGGKELMGRHSSRNMMEALDEAIFKFERQVSKRSDRRSHRPHERRQNRVVAGVSDALQADAEDELARRAQVTVYA